MGTLTARMQVALGPRDVEEGAILVDQPPLVHAADLPKCELCEEPWCPMHRQHFADCACVGLTQDTGIVGALDTECGYTKATFQSVLMGHIIPTVDKQSGAVSEGVTATLKTDLAHQMEPVVVAPTLSASNNPSRSPQSADVTAQVAAVFAAEVAPTLPSSGAGVARTGNERTEAEFVVVQPIPILEATARQGKTTEGSAGIGKPGDPMYTLTGKQHGVFQPVAWDEEVNAAPPGLGPTLGRGGAGGQHDGVVAFGENQRREVRTSEVALQLTAGGGKPGQGYPAIHQPLGRPRRLLPVECERLMSWPDDHTLVPDPRGKPMADSHRYKMCGNGVVANVAEWIGRRLLEAEAASRLEEDAPDTEIRLDPAPVRRSA